MTSSKEIVEPTNKLSAACFINQSGLIDSPIKHSARARARHILTKVMGQKVRAKRWFGVSFFFNEITYSLKESTGN